jgi:predicted permease
VAIAAAYAGRASSARQAVLKLLRFPPVLGSLAGLASRGVALPVAVESVLERLASLVVPLALLSVGMRIRVDRASLSRDAGPLTAGLVVKLALSPAIALAFARGAGLTGRDLAVTVAQCAMAPMVTAAMVAADHELRADLAAALVAAGALASMITVPLWSVLLRALGL